jgi:hypothetical protein
MPTMISVASVVANWHLRMISVDGCDALHNLRYSVRPKMALMTEGVYFHAA